MGNGPLKDKLKQRTDFLGKGERGEYWTKLEYFYSNEVPGDENEKFETFEKLMNTNPELMKIIEDANLTPEADTMLSQDGFFDSIDESVAKKMYEAITK